MKKKSHLKLLRESRKVKLTELALSIGIGTSRYCMIESGARPATPDIAMAISHYFNVPVDSIFVPNSFTVCEVAESSTYKEAIS